jgi:hypothetical protein
MADDIARYLADRGRQLLSDFESQPKRPPLETFAAVETIWREVVEPALPTFHTMQPSWDGREPSPGSRWRRNWPTG